MGYDKITDTVSPVLEHGSDCAKERFGAMVGNRTATIPDAQELETKGNRSTPSRTVPTGTEVLIR